MSMLKNHFVNLCLKKVVAFSQPVCRHEEVQETGYWILDAGFCY